MFRSIIFFLLLFCFSMSHAATITLGGGCSLKDAIESANRDAPEGSCAAGSGSDEIVSPDVWFLYLTETLPIITSDITIRTQTAAGKLFISGQDQHRILVATGQDTHLTLTRVELSHGYRPNVLARGGAAMLIDDATVTINDSRIVNNTVTNSRGGAINILNGTLNINNTVLEHNETLTGSLPSATHGGAIFAKDSELTVSDSTFQGNIAGGNEGNGASIYMDEGTLNFEQSLIRDSNTGIFGVSTSATIVNSTFYDNSGDQFWDDLIIFTEYSVVTLKHITLSGRAIFGDSIIYASNSWIHDCLTDEETWALDSHNAYFTDNCNGNDGQSIQLPPLNDNGGPTLTRALRIGSVLINAGDPDHCTAIDQRGEARDDLCDVGAFEATGFADVSVSSELSQAEPFASDQTFTYTAKIKNHGPGVATAVDVSLDTNNVFVNSIDSPLCSSFPCGIDTIQAQQEISIPITMKAGHHSLDTFDITLEAASTNNSSHVDIDEGDDPSNNIKTETFAVVAAADMKIEMDLITAPPYYVGQPISYEATLINLGPQNVTGITFNFLPTNLDITGFTGCSAVNGNSCSTLGLLNGQSRTVIVNATIQDNQFDAVGTVSSVLLDINLANNMDEQLNGGGVNEADISVHMTMTQDAPLYSEQYVHFKISLHGDDTEDASNITIWSEFPGALVNSHGGCPFLPCTIASLPAGAEMIFEFDFLAPVFEQGSVETFMHRIFVMPGQQDPDISNNEVIIKGGLDPVANTAVFATLVTQPPYVENQEIEYQVRVVNVGINTATNVEINVASGNLDWVWADGDQCADISCQLAEMLRTQEEYITVVYRIREPGLFNLKVTTSSDELDLEPSNNVSTVYATAGAQVPGEAIFHHGFE